MRTFPRRACVLPVIFLLLSQKPQTVAATECNPSASTAQQCNGNGQCVRAAVSAEDRGNEEAFTCRCFAGFYGSDCSELDEQAAKLAGESDGYRVVRRTTIIHHRSPYVHPAVVPAVVPMPMVIPAPVAPAPIIVDDPYHSSTVVYTHSGVSWVPIFIMSLIAIAVIIGIIICCCAAGSSQTESVVYSNGYQQPFLADQGTTVTVIEDTYDDGKGPQPPSQYQQQQQQHPQQQSNVVYPTQVTAPTGQVIYQQPAPPTGYQYVTNQQPSTQMYQNGLHPQTQSVPMTQQAPSFPQATAPPAFNPEIAGTRQ